MPALRSALHDPGPGLREIGRRPAFERQLAAVQRSILGSLANADRLAKLPLQNSDEPAVIFRADLP